MAAPCWPAEQLAGPLPVAVVEPEVGLQLDWARSMQDSRLCWFRRVEIAAAVAGRTVVWLVGAAALGSRISDHRLGRPRRPRLTLAVAPRAPPEVEPAAAVGEQRTVAAGIAGVEVVVVAVIAVAVRIELVRD